VARLPLGPGPPRARPLLRHRSVGDTRRPRRRPVRLNSPDDFWDAVLGSGYRATADALSPARRAQVRDRVLAELRSRDTTAITTNVVYGTARKPA
jgi:hypothetical protein